MVISERTRFWLKVVLTATFPIWIIPAAIAGAISVFFIMAWECVSYLIDPSDEAKA